MRYIYLLIVFLVSWNCYAEDMQKYMQETRVLVDTGEYEEALKRTIWFHDHALEHQPSMYGVRLSFALKDWIEFGEKHPPALTALINIRDKKTNILRSGNGDRHLFQDVRSINRTLSEAKKTADLFSFLDKNQPKLAKDVWKIAKESLIEAKAYALLKKYIGNVLREYTIEEGYFKENVDRFSKEKYGDRMIGHAENRLVEQAIQYINLALALNDKESAIQIKSRAQSLVKDYRLEDVVIK